MITKICAQIEFHRERCKMPLRARKSVTHQMIAEVSKAAAALREACAAEPAYQTADDLWKALKGKRPGGATGVNICTATQVQQKSAPQFTSSYKAEGKALGAHFATGGLEPVPIDASTGSTKQEKTGKHNRVPNANRKTNKSTTWASRRCRRYSGRTGSSSTQSNVVNGAFVVLRAVDRQLVLGIIHDTPRRR